MSDGKLDLSRLELQLHLLCKKYATTPSEEHILKEKGASFISLLSDLENSFHNDVLMSLDGLLQEAHSDEVSSALPFRKVKGKPRRITEHVFYPQQCASPEKFIKALRHKFTYFYVEGIANEERPDEVKKLVTRTLIERVAKIPFDEIPEKIDYKFFTDHGLGAFLNTFYNNSPSDAVIHAYGEDVFKPWNFSSSPMNYWIGTLGKYRALSAVKWFAKEYKL